MFSHLALPSLVLVTPDLPFPYSPKQQARFLSTLEKAVKNGICLVELRLKSLPEALYGEIAKAVISLCHAKGCKILLNGHRKKAFILGADGVHLTSEQLFLQKECPKEVQLLSASCHNEKELKRAEELGVDFAMLGPVLKTKSHPGVSPLGWKTFQDLIEPVPFPVYAIGGLAPAHLPRVWQAGGQGIAAIRSLWS
ncbi:MAG: thiamine phosphate synthase [Gammaproteobacteria bacterium]|nr:thiamine phosphate synthase [Gammaproteobacteria bacterium]